MRLRIVLPRVVERATMTSAMLLAVSHFAAGELVAQDGARNARGNIAGEWRYWAGDAWSTRYSTLDQINAQNFSSLKVAWEWNAGEFGDDEYYRVTPLYANGRLLTLATTHRGAMAVDPATGKTLWKWMLDE